MKKKLGQPFKYDGTTKVLSIRVPLIRYDHYKKVFSNFLEVNEKYKHNNNVT